MAAPFETESAGAAIRTEVVRDIDPFEPAREEISDDALEGSTATCVAALSAFKEKAAAAAGQDNLTVNGA